MKRDKGYQAKIRRGKGVERHNQTEEKGRAGAETA